MLVAILFDWDFLLLQSAPSIFRPTSNGRVVVSLWVSLWEQVDIKVSVFRSSNVIAVVASQIAGHAHKIPSWNQAMATAFPRTRLASLRFGFGLLRFGYLDQELAQGIK